MDLLTLRSARRLARLVTTGAGLLIVVSLCASIWTPGDPCLTIAPGPHGKPVVTWIAPDGPAWSAGIRPGDTIVSRTARDPSRGDTVVRHGRDTIVPRLAGMRPSLPDLLATGLGLGLLLCGLLLRLRSPDREAGGAFWRMGLLGGLALGLVPAGVHGLPWALIPQFAALRLAGPALLEATLALPRRRRGLPRRRWSRPLIWLPALALLAVYPFCWWRPDPLFSLLQEADSLVLGGYIVSACVRAVSLLRQPRPSNERPPLHWLAPVGLLAGFLPFVIFTLLPSVVPNGAMAPAQLSILSLALLPLCIGAAVVRAEFLGVTALLRRRTLRVVVWVVLLAGVAMTAGWLADIGSTRWRLPSSMVTVGAAVLAALGAATLRPRLTRDAERLVLHDVYDVDEVLRQVRAELADAAPAAIGTPVVTRLVMALDLTDALLLAPGDGEHWAYAHPRTVEPVATSCALIEHARRLFVDPPPHGPFVEQADDQPVYVLPLWDGADLLAVLCLGPKRGDDAYSARDQALLDLLAPHLTLVFANRRLQRRLEEQARAAPSLRAEAPVPREDHGLNRGAGNAATPLTRQQAATLTARQAALPLARQHAITPLTRQQMTALRYLAEGLTDKEIAGRMGIAQKTASKHIENVYTTLDAHSRVEAVNIARREHLLPSDDR